MPAGLAGLTGVNDVYRTALPQLSGEVFLTDSADDDLSYLEAYNWWNLLAQSFPEARRAPHDVPALLPAIRRARQALALAAKQ